MKYFFLSIFFAMVLSGLPKSARATEIGFVPASGIWFSKQAIAPGEIVKIYAVIINNAYPAVQADIAFYDNGDEMGIIKVAKLEKEQAHELWVQWTPQPGAHKIAARFIRASVISADGQKTTLDTDELNTIGESSFVAPSGAAAGSAAVNVSGQSGAVSSGDIVASSTAAFDALPDAGALGGSGVTVQVKKEGNGLMLKIVPPDMATAAASLAGTENAQSAKIGTVTSKNNDSVLIKNMAASSAQVPRARNAIEVVAEKIRNVGESVKEAREITTRTIRKARALAEQGRESAEAVGQVVRGVNRNKIALAWGGFLAFIALAGALSYVRWKKFR